MSTISLIFTMSAPIFFGIWLSDFIIQFIKTVNKQNFSKWSAVILRRYAEFQTGIARDFSMIKMYIIYIIWKLIFRRFDYSHCNLYILNILIILDCANFQWKYFIFDFIWISSKSTIVQIFCTNFVNSCFRSKIIFLFSNVLL